MTSGSQRTWSCRHSLRGFEADVAQKALEPLVGALEGVLEANDLLGQLGPDGLQVAGRVDGGRRVGVEPALHRGLVLGPMGLVVGQQLEQRARAALLAGGAGLAGAPDRPRPQ